MKRSINEIQGMVLKAARGAAVPLGVCEDLSRAVPFFIQNNALDQVVHLIETCCPEAQAAIDAVSCGHPAAAPDGVPETAMTCLAAAQGISLRSQDGQLLLGKDAPMAPAAGPQDVSEAIWAKLEAWAAKTYVPSSEASRNAGAGAGLTDND